MRGMASKITTGLAVYRPFWVSVGLAAAITVSLHAAVGLGVTDHFLRHAGQGCAIEHVTQCDGVDAVGQWLRAAFDVGADRTVGVLYIISRTDRSQCTGAQHIAHFLVFTEVRIPRLSVENLAWNGGADIDGRARFFRSERYRRAQGQQGHRNGDCKLLEHC